MEIKLNIKDSLITKNGTIGVITKKTIEANNESLYIYEIQLVNKEKTIVHFTEVDINETIQYNMEYRYECHIKLIM